MNRDLDRIRAIALKAETFALNQHWSGEIPGFTSEQIVHRVEQARTAGLIEADILSRMASLFLVFTALISVCFSAAHLNAQLPAAGDAEKILHGSIFTAQGQPAANASVEVRDLRGIKVGSGVTNTAGSFEISGPALSGNYIFVVARAFPIKYEQLLLNQADLELSLALPEDEESTAPGTARYAVSAKRLAVPAKTWTHIIKAQHAFNHTDFDAALAEINHALQAEPKCAQAFSLRALIQLAQKSPEEALKDAQRAAFLDPSDELAYLAMSTAFNSVNEFANAENAAKHALGLDPDSWQARLELAKSLYGSGQFILAVRELDLLDRDFPDVHLVRGNVLIRLGRRIEGMDEFRAFLREAPNDRRREPIEQIVASGRTRQPRLQP